MRACPRPPGSAASAASRPAAAAAWMKPSSSRSSAEAPPGGRPRERGQLAARRPQHRLPPRAAGRRQPASSRVCDVLHPTARPRHRAPPAAALQQPAVVSNEQLLEQGGQWPQTCVSGLDEQPLFTRVPLPSLARTHSVAAAIVSPPAYLPRPPLPARLREPPHVDGVQDSCGGGRGQGPECMLMTGTGASHLLRASDGLGRF
jgi:hypothetical protein